MQFAPRRPHAELAARNDANAELGGFVGRIDDAVRGVVIGQGDRGETDRARVPREFGRLGLAVGRRRMAMQINVRRS
jgi:hypothetical protein